MFIYFFLIFSHAYLNFQTHFPETIKEDLIDLLGVKQSLIYNQLRRFSLSNKSLLVEQKSENNPKVTYNIYIY